MSMFDTIEVPKEFLPLPNNFIKTLPDVISFQTRDLGENLDTYIVDDTAQLIEYVINSEGTTYYFNYDYDGYVLFYGYINETMYEFKANFSNGKLISVVNSDNTINTIIIL